MDDYASFIERKSQLSGDYGFDPVWMPDMLFPFQRACVEWACRKGRAALFEDCGLGKTFQQLVWAENVARHSGGRVLILTPLAVSFQTVREGEKIGVEVTHRRDGLHAGDRIVVTNYERLHHFSADDFAGVVCDESSILKNFDGETRKAVTDFMRKRPYRLLCTATAAPNDYIELGTSSEALGHMGFSDMLGRFFKQQTGVSYRLTSRVSHSSGIEVGGFGKYRFRGHAERDFWRWVVSWARAMRQPSDLGFGNGSFALPPLTVNDHVVKVATPRDGYLFDIPAVGLAEQRSDLRRSISERCEMAAALISAHDRPAVAWCNLNEEAHTVTKLISGAVEVEGSDSEERKEECFAAFAIGDIRVLVTKSSIAGFGLNWQHCAHMTFFPSHSYEQYYQSMRRCWRFGQRNPVCVDIITTEGQKNVLQNLERKSESASKMFDRLVGMMWQELKIEKKQAATMKTEVAKWL
jgi:hypothetical protein